MATKIFRNHTFSTGLVVTLKRLNPLETKLILGGLDLPPQPIPPLKPVQYGGEGGYSANEPDENDPEYIQAMNAYGMEALDKFARALLRVAVVTKLEAVLQRLAAIETDSEGDPFTADTLWAFYESHAKDIYGIETPRDDEMLEIILVNQFEGAKEIQEFITMMQGGGNPTSEGVEQSKSAV
jgi:hypothetical protein